MQSDLASDTYIPQNEYCTAVLVGDMAAALTDDADLHLLIDGQRINGTVHADGVYEFRLSQTPRHAQIVSRAGVPKALGLTRDPRLLGVALRRIVVWRGRRLRVLDADSPALIEGFHGFEAEHGFRWTDGNAALPTSLFEGLSGTCTIELAVACTARYPLAAPPPRRRAA
jgi:hypothetical protein